MKKFLLMAVVALMSLSASAENLYIGGSFGYDHVKVDDEKSDEFSIAPEIGYNLNSNWAVGAALNYTWKKDSYNIFTINPYARYTYFRTENNLLSLFVDGGFGIGYIKPDEGDSTTTWSIGLKPGLALNVTEKFSFVAHVGFFGYEDFKEAGKHTGFGFNGNNLEFGFYYNF